MRLAWSALGHNARSSFHVRLTLALIRLVRNETLIGVMG